MTKKKLIIIIAIVLIFIILLACLILNNKKNNENINISNDSTSAIQYDSENLVYYMKDENTGEVLHESSSKEDLEIYTIDPDYDPKNPDFLANEIN